MLLSFLRYIEKISCIENDLNCTQTGRVLQQSKDSAMHES